MQENEVQEETEVRQTPKSLCNKNYLLLWQGSLVSTVGDSLYEIALGFWILAVTGSTALMGTLMAATILPRTLISPFAGAIVDRSDRKWLLIAMDLIRGVAITFVGVMALLGLIKIWMVFAAGVILGICAAFFMPATQSAMPDLVPPKQIIKANSAFSVIHSASGILGNAVGGFLFLWLGAPLLFFLNGISFLVSAFSEIFISIPSIKTAGAIKTSFWSDVKDGLRFVLKLRGLKILLISVAVNNLFSSMAMILIMPLFQRNEALGAGNYGLAMGGFAAGMFVGFLVLSFVNIKSKYRCLVFLTLALLAMSTMAVFPYIEIVPLMIAMIFFYGLVLSINNTFITSSMQLMVPRQKLGKVFGLLGMMAGGLSPLGMAVGGVLAEFIPLHLLICGCFLVMFSLYIFLAFIKDVRDFICYEPPEAVEKQI